MLEASVSPSEDPEKVLAAMMKIVTGEPDAVYRGERMLKVVARGAGSLEGLRDQLRDRHVRGAARRLLLVGMKRSSTSMMLNRQAAAAGVLAVCASPDQSALGPIFVTLESKQIQEVVDWLSAFESG